MRVFHSTARIASWWGSAPRRPVRALHHAGVTSLAVYAATAAATALWPTASKWVNEPARCAMVATLLGAFAVGYRAVRSLPPSPRVTRVVVGYAVALVAVVVLVRPFHSSDLYTYINRGWQQAEYGVNPYAVMVYETPNGLTDPMFYPKWQFNPCPYGFLFALETWVISAAAGRDYVLTVALHKAAAVAAFGLLGLAVWAGLRRFRPDAPHAGLFLYAWNPLLLLHHVGHGHNDLQMVLGVAVAVLAAAAGWWVVVLPALAVAALVKLPAAAVAPVVGLYVVRRFGWAKALASLVLAGAIVAAASAPYLDGLLTRRPEATAMTTEDLTSPHNSLASMALFPVKLAAPGVHRDAVTVVRLLAAVGFATFYLVVLRRSLSRPADASGLARDVVLILTGLVLFSPKFHAWYVAFFLPLALWLPPGDRARRVALAVGVGATLGFTRVYQADFANALLMLALPLAWALRRADRTSDEPQTQQLPDLPEVPGEVSRRAAA